MIIIYGIPNCHTVKKAKVWLDEHNVEYELWDYKKKGIDRQRLEQFCSKFGWETVLNRRGQMWRKAHPMEKKEVIDEASAIDFMMNTPTSIKRPIIEVEGKVVLIGFDEGEYSSVLQNV